MSGLRDYELVERISNLLRVELRQEGAKHGLQPAHLQALAYFARANRYSNTPAALTDYLGVTKGTASQTLMVLEGLRLVTKREDKDDRRVTRVALTPKGSSLLDKLLPPAVWGRANASLGVAATRQIDEAMVELLRALQVANQSRTFGVCNTCTHLLREGGRKFRCGLTGEALDNEDISLICREHAVG
ncbi:MAG: MarR family winged helix-turn-helix transcriptional regulator [Gammaproteobacteria bacterium]|nr:MarR family winged helix-turn-helix transcriptional regulator [Gammaproteobacteria bacterium]